MNKRLTQGVMLACIVSAVPFFFVGGPAYHDSRSFQDAWNIGHVLFFTLFSLLLFDFLPSERDRHHLRIPFWRGFFFVLVIGIAVEVVQMCLDGRMADVNDLLRNQLGFTIAWVLIIPRRYGRIMPVRTRVKAVVVLFIALALWPLSRDITDELIAKRQFPVLANFETPFEKKRWIEPGQLSFDEHVVREGKRSLRVRLSTAHYSGTSLFFFPHNWKGYKRLRFSVYNPLETKLVFHCRIHDKLHKSHGNQYSDRFHRKFLLHPGWNDLAVSLDKVRTSPKTREMDMERIEQLGFFVVLQPRPLTIYLDNVYLEN